MEITSDKYKSSDICSFINNGSKDDSWLYEDFGYFLVDQMMVPYHFLQRLEDHLYKKEIVYGKVMSVEDVYGEEFWASLSYMEKKVVGACILILLESHMPVTLPD